MASSWRLSWWFFRVHAFSITLFVYLGSFWGDLGKLKWDPFQYSVCQCWRDARQRSVVQKWLDSYPIVCRPEISRYKMVSFCSWPVHAIHWYDLELHGPWVHATWSQGRSTDQDLLGINVLRCSVYHFHTRCNVFVQDCVDFGPYLDQGLSVLFIYIVFDIFYCVIILTP